MVLRSTLCFLVLCVSGVAASAPSTNDLRRAKTWKPRSGYRGTGNLVSSNMQLNRHLAKTSGLRLRECVDFTVPELRSVLRELYPLASAELQAIYSKIDGRRPMYKTVQEMELHWETVPSSDPRVRDGHCHEAVMWFTHHLTAEAKRIAMLKLTLPKLPNADHSSTSRAANDVAGAFYDEKVTCQKCHINGLVTLGAPEIKPVTKKELARRCYTNYGDLFNLTCGPCDGVAGKYWGDDDNKYFEPDECVVVATPEEVPENERVQARFPNQFSVDILTGSDRWGRTTNPAVSPKMGMPTFMNSMYGEISGKWFVDITPDSDLWLLRHDTAYKNIHFNGTHAPFIGFHVSEIHSQTKKQQQENSTGPMVSLVNGIPHWIPGGCTCVPDPVGNVDMTRTRLPGLGEMKYLGRIKLTLSEHKGEVVELDHWALWFFHIFMEVDKSSKFYGKAPKRLASAYAGTAVYDNWVFADPKIADPTVWNRGIPTKPMAVGPDKGKYCMNPTKIPDCDNITQATFPPAPEHSSSKAREVPWHVIHEAFFPNLAAARTELTAKATVMSNQILV